MYITHSCIGLNPQCIARINVSLDTYMYCKICIPDRLKWYIPVFKKGKAIEMYTFMFVWLCTYSKTKHTWLHGRFKMATIGTNYIIISSTVGVLKKKRCEMSCGGTDSSVLTPNFRVNNFALCHSLSSLVWKTFCFCVVFLDIVRTFSLTLKN